jgi:hypothetical protein
MSDGYRVQAGEPPAELEGPSLDLWWRAEKRRLREEMIQIAFDLFPPDPGEAEDLH